MKTKKEVAVADYSQVIEQIHNAFYEEICKPISENQKETLSRIGIKLFPPPEYSVLFPAHKIIHINRIISLCEKYKLELGTTEQYVGTIPSKNIDEIENFITKHPFYKKEVDNTGRIYKFEDTNHGESKNFKSLFQWQIVAPPSMIISNEVRKKTIVSAPDPIIIAMIKPEVGFAVNDAPELGVVVTAWGDEIGNPIAVNEKNN